MYPLMCPILILIAQTPIFSIKSFRRPTMCSCLNS